MASELPDPTLESVTAALRRVPRQPRSRARVLSVLDAADGLLASEGAEALTTTRVAAAAGISVGSLYQYFPDKETIVEALALSYWSDLADLVEVAAEAEERESAGEPIASVIDALAAGFRARPGFLALWFGGLRSERVRDVTRPGRIQVGQAIERILRVRYPRSGAMERATVARMVVLAGDGLLREAFRLDRDGDEAVLTESKRMLNSYVTAAMGGSSQAPGADGR